MSLFELKLTIAKNKCPVPSGQATSFRCYGHGDAFRRSRCSILLISMSLRPYDASATTLMSHPTLPAGAAIAGFVMADISWYHGRHQLVSWQTSAGIMADISWYHGRHQLVSWQTSAGNGMLRTGVQSIQTDTQNSQYCKGDINEIGEDLGRQNGELEQ